MKDFKRLVAMLLLVGMLCSFAVPATFAEEAAASEATTAPETTTEATYATKATEETTAPGETVVPEETTVLTSGTIGDNLTWTLVLSTGTLTISGTGDMFSFSLAELPWLEDQNSVTNVVIEEGVTSIGQKAFYNWTNLTSITIPESVTRIVEGAFYGCSALDVVYYGGMVDQWNVIQIDENNDCLENANINYAEAPIVSLEIEPLTIVEYTNGSWQNAYNPDTGEYDRKYYCYNGWELLQNVVYTITFRDGTVLTGTGNNGFEYNGGWYYLDYMMQQSYENQWTAGNTYTMTVTTIGEYPLGAYAQVPVTIEPSPVESLEVTPMTTVEYANGNWQNVYNPDTGDYDLKYYYYEGWNLLQSATCTITFRDGTVQTCDGNSNFQYNGEWYSLSFTTDQSYENQWTAGNTYMMSVSAMGKTVEVPVTIEASPLVSLEFAPICVMKETCGYWSGHYFDNGEYAEYYHYSGWNLLQRSTYTATFSDGTVLTGSNNGFDYNGTWYSFNYNENQSYYNQWTVDNTYTLTVSTMGQTVEVPVTIESSPLVSLEFTPVFLEKETCGYWSNDYNPETGNYDLQYFYYDSWSIREKITYTATFKDGTVVTDSALNSLYYGGSWYSINYDMPYQNYEDRWLPGNTYTITFTVLGYTAECPVTICEATNAGGYTYLNQNGMAVITDCTLTDAVLQIPDTIDGLPVVGITSLGTAIKTATEIVIPDSVRMLSSGVFKFSNDDMYEAEDDNLIPLQKLTLGSGISNLSIEMLRKAKSLEKIVVAAGNPNYSSVDGVVYSKDFSTLIAYPPAKASMHYVPDSVTDVGIIVRYPELYCDIRIQFGEGVEDYVIADGVIYSADMTKVFMATGNAPTSYVMPDTVTEMAEKVFAGSNFTEVTISSGVTEIVYFAFGGCDKLEKVNIPESVVSIASGAFQDCTSLKSADIPGSVRSIFYAAYAGCNALEQVNITDLAAWCNIYFSDATANPLHKAKNLYVSGEKVTDLVIPDSVTDICYYTFTYMDVNTVTLPEGVAYIGREVFANSTLTSIDMPESVMRLGYKTFFSCKNLKSIQLNEGMTDIPDGCFYESGLEAVTIPASVSYIGYSAFREAALTEVIFNCKDAFIGDNAFSNCPLRELNLENLNSLGTWETFTGTLVTNLKIPNTVTQISYRVFAYNNNLVSVTIPDSVEFISENAFEGDDNLSHVLYTGTEDQWAAIGVESEELNRATIHYEAVGDEVTVQQTCTTVTFYCSICDKWETVTKPRANHNLVDGVCADCGHEGEWGYYVDEAAGTVTITDYFGEETDVKIPETIKGNPVAAVAKSTFYRNRKITSVEIPGSIKAIADYAFYDCDKLTEVTLGKGVTTIGNSAFYNCDSLRGLELPESITAIGEYAFALGGLKSIVIPKGVTEIAYCTFWNSKLVTITIPESVTSIDDGAFQWVWSLKTVSFTGFEDLWNAIEIGEYNEGLLEADIQFMKACQHSRIEDGVCVTCGEKIGSILTDSQGNIEMFATFEEALEAAEEGQTLSMHTDVVEEDLVLPSGVDLDLNGYTLTVDSVLTFSGGDIVDNSEDVSGLLKVGAVDGNMISSDNSQLPVYDNENGGFRFFAVDVESKAVTGRKTENPKYWFKIDTRNFARFNDLIQGGAKLQIKVKMTWEGQSEPVYAAADMEFTKHWAEGFKDNERVCITVSATGAESLTNFELIPCVVANGVEISGEEMN